MVIRYIKAYSNFLGKNIFHVYKFIPKFYYHFREVKITKGIKFCRYLIEALIALPLYVILSIIPISISSSIMGKIFIWLGSLLSVNKIADKNISRCFPHLSSMQKEIIIKEMWNNLGKIVGELPHWHRFSNQQLKTFVNLPDNLSSSQVILVSGHLGNWELNSRIMKYYGIKPIFVYRPMNNPIINWLINRTRALNGVELIAKGTSNLKALIQGIKQGKSIGMLVDQRHDSGVNLNFFNQDTKSITAPAQLALKYNIPIILVMVRRISQSTKTSWFKQPRFELLVRHLIPTPEDSPRSLMQKIYQVLEEWIVNNKEQWFWLHKRWRDR